MKFTYDFLMNMFYVGKHLSELSYDEKYQTTRYNIAFDLIERISVNVNAAYNVYNRRALLDPNDIASFKVPIDLSLRSAITDSMLLLYLLSQEDSILEEEILILNMDYAKFAKSFLDVQYDWAVNFLKADLWKKATKDKYIYDRFKFDDYLNTKHDSLDQWKWKTNKELRNNSNPNTGQLTIKSIYEYLHNSSDPILRECSYMYMSYKLFSQIEHYTYFGRQYSKLMYDPESYKMLAHMLNLSIKKSLSYLPFCEKEVIDMVNALDITDYFEIEGGVSIQDAIVVKLYDRVGYHGCHYEKKDADPIIYLEDKKLYVNDIVTINRADICGVEIMVANNVGEKILIRIFASHEYDEYIKDGVCIKDVLLDAQDLNHITNILETLK